MSAADESTRRSGSRMAAKRGTRINNTNKVDFSGAKIGAFNSGNSSSSAAAGKGAKATSKTATKDKKVVSGMAMMMMMNSGGSGSSNGGSDGGSGGHRSAHIVTHRSCSQSHLSCPLESESLHWPRK